MTAAALLDRLREKGVAVQVDGDTLRLRPASVLTPEELESARRLKGEVLALLRRSTGLPDLDPATVREVLGSDAQDPHALACLAFDVAEAVRALETEIRAGAIRPGIRTVHGRPLADWLSLDEVARLLRMSEVRRR